MSRLNKIDDLSIQTIRFLSMEGVQAAKSGHPGMPMGMAAAAYALWQRHLKFDPSDPDWINRDRFVLSAGHGSMLLYSLLHLFGYDLSLDELKNFRQWGSKTPGHPEYGHTPGVEVTTGPLGQGIANAVGMAISQKYLANRYNKKDFPIFDYNVYTICGDGCLQEGVSGEASSLAGHLGLDNLVVVYDDNHITIDGNTELSFSEDVAKRYEAYGWNVIELGGDGNDIDALTEAIQQAQQQTKAPTLVKFRSHIGFGSPNFQDTHTAHGAPLGDDEIKLIKKNAGWDPDKKFVVPAEVAVHTGAAKEKGAKLSAEYKTLLDAYAKAYPELAVELNDAIAGEVTIDDGALPVFDPEKPLATRAASGKTLAALMPSMPLVLGGSADLTPSNNTHFPGAEDFQKDNPGGRYIRYGVREHGMAAVMNGISAGKLLRPYAGTFLVFADYMRGSIRVAALAKYPTIFVFTHDSIGVGEDGPTHQPVETVASLRILPNLLVFRPADANETVLMWKYMLEHNDAPCATALTRQNLPILDPAKYPQMKKNFNKGAYVLVPQDKPDVLLLATGSEVSLAMEAAEKLAADGTKAQVVSMPCWKLFERQDAAYKESVIPASVQARVGVEAGVDAGWWKYLGTDGEFVGMNSFGASAPGGTCFKKFGITTEAVIAAAKKSMAK
ncbi:MAG: transketolase [Planctomycetes bacterium]|nr:transketolase [Planctomycetota bacterium]